MPIYTAEEEDALDPVAQKRRELDALQQAATERKKNKQGEMGSAIGSIIGAAAALISGNPQALSAGSSLGGALGGMVGKGEMEGSDIKKGLSSLGSLSADGEDADQEQLKKLLTAKGLL